ncbi:hypothetical protein JFV29_14885 [Peribacillus sp. TH16]|uniref:hypothetical protein n=1 Tax=Peribacillus sp. TH16 TaxID=2798482 RepID=UPI0019148F4B|nr:hypothetical protein [Peribacillus sp. TH16]MBK5483149.1 hypothetical protein [Peribacillus sp. TH16]
MKKTKPFMVLFMMIFCYIFISGCSKESKQKERFESFSQMLSKQDYGRLITLLSSVNEKMQIRPI